MTSQQHQVFNQVNADVTGRFLVLVTAVGVACKGELLAAGKARRLREEAYVALPAA